MFIDEYFLKLFCPDIDISIFRFIDNLFCINKQYCNNIRINERGATNILRLDKKVIKKLTFDDISLLIVISCLLQIKFRFLKYNIKEL